MKEADAAIDVVPDPDQVGEVGQILHRLIRLEDVAEDQVVRDMGLVRAAKLELVLAARSVDDQLAAGEESSPSRNPDSSSAATQ